MPEPSPAPGRLAAWWEARPTGVQVAIAFPPLAILLFAVNAGPFNQPLLRAAFYGLFEGAVAVALLIYATRTEMAKRRGGGGGE